MGIGPSRERATYPSSAESDISRTALTTSPIAPMPSCSWAQAWRSSAGASSSDTVAAASQSSIMQPSIHPSTRARAVVTLGRAVEQKFPPQAGRRCARCATLAPQTPKAGCVRRTSERELKRHVLPPPRWEKGRPMGGLFSAN